MKNKVAFIGPEGIHAAFQNIDENWDFQSPIETLDEFEEEITTEKENPKIAEDTSVILLFSRLFDSKNQEQFAKLAAYLTPYSAVCILFPESDGESQKEIIRYAIKTQQEELGEDNSDYSNEIPFYFVPYESPQEGLSQALSLYVRDPHANPQSRENILRSLPDNIARTLEEENDEAEIDFSSNDDGGVILPERSANATGRVIAVTSSKGGSGKSSISSFLAAYLAKGSKAGYEAGLESKPLRVCVVDLDVRDGQLGFLNGRQSPTVVDILGEGTINPESVSQGVYHSNKMGCDFIFAAKRPRYTKAIPPEFYANLINTLREMYDYIILDTSVNYLDPLLENVAYPMADKIVFVTDLGISSIFGMARWISETTRVEDSNEPVDIEKIGIVVNKVMPDINMSLDKVRAAASGCPLLAAFPSKPGLITLAANTCSLEQVLNEPSMNSMTKRLATMLVDSTGYKLGEVPFTA